MITSYLQLLQLTVEKYESVPKLNKKNDPMRKPWLSRICYYAPVDPETTIGCGIGCHLALNKAQLLDKLFDPLTGTSGIGRVFSSETGISIISEVFDVDAIGLANLRAFQRLHDGSTTVEDYLTKLHEAIEEEEIIIAKVRANTEEV